MREDLRRQYGNPYPVETAIFQLDQPGLSAEVTRTLFHCARPYMESFTIYGENACYEWQMEDEDPALFRMSPVVPEQVRSVSVEHPEPPDRADLLPPEVGNTPGALCTATRTATCPSNRAAGTTARTRTWCTSSCAASSKSARPPSTP